MLSILLQMHSTIASRGWKLLWAVALGCSPAGCSFALVNGPPSHHEKIAYFDCSASNALPTIDVLLAGLTALDTLGVAAGNAGVQSSKAELAGFGLAAAAFAASAIYGYGKTSECREAQTAMLTRAARTPTLANPPGFASPPPAPYDPWVAPVLPANPPPPIMTPVGPLPAAPAPAPPPATDSETPRSGSDVPRPGKAVQ